MFLVLVHPLEKDKTLFIVQNLQDIHDCYLQSLLLFLLLLNYYYYYYYDGDDLLKIQWTYSYTVN